MCSFYKLNSEVLRFTENDIDELRFNQLIIRKENYQRLNKNDTLEKGLFRMTIRTVSTDLGITVGRARGLIKKFEKMGIIACDTGAKNQKEGSIYAYLSVYEGKIRNKKTNTAANTATNTAKVDNSNGCGEGANTVTNTVDNTSKKENIKRINKNTYFETSDEVKIANYLYELILKNNPKAKKPNIQKWADVINKIIRIDERSEEDIRKVIKYSQSDDFWLSVILSPTNLRKNFDKLYLKANKKAPVTAGANKNNSYDNSICNNSRSYTQKIEGSKFV